MFRTNSLTGVNHTLKTSKLCQQASRSNSCGFISFLGIGSLVTCSILEMCPSNTPVAITMPSEMSHSRLKPVNSACWWDSMAQASLLLLNTSLLSKLYAGKSTILKLLNRLYDPTEGSILVDGRDIKTLKLADLRRCISVLFQDYTHFPLSVCQFSIVTSSLIAFHLDRSKRILA